MIAISEHVRKCSCGPHPGADVPFPQIPHLLANNKKKVK